MSVDKVKMRSETRRRRLLENKGNRMKRILGDEMITASKEEESSLNENDNLSPTKTESDSSILDYQSIIHRIKEENDNKPIVAEESQHEIMNNCKHTNCVTPTLTTEPTVVSNKQDVQIDNFKTQASLLCLASGVFVCLCFLVLKPQNISFPFGYFITEVIIAMLYPNCFAFRGNFFSALVTILLKRISFSEETAARLNQLLSCAQICTLHFCLYCFGFFVTYRFLIDMNVM